jgi:hypothetical protein
MNLRSTLNHLEAGLVLEIQSKAESLAWVESLESAVRSNDSAEFEKLVANGAGLCKAGESIARKRVALITELGRHWGVAAAALTLGGVARRVGADGKRLEQLREQLRTVISKVMKRQRRLAALIGMHRRINTDVMQIMLGCDSKEEVHQGGCLVNAEA